uniref:SET domain-containing protein n=1 Tax=Sander lucioperca TaxID=283035 RepID=A0A8D0D302_SANLU
MFMDVIVISYLQLHFRYKIPSVTSQTARRVFETATKTCSEQEKAMVAKYLSHSTATADKHYRMLQPDMVCQAKKLIATLAGDSAHFNRRQPSEQRIIAYINKQGWESNVPNGAKLFNEWKPSGKEDHVMDSQQIQKLVKSQKWKGLHITDIEGKGKGVLATRTFQPGEVICDYHGSIVTAKKGKEIHQETSEEETGYVFFYTNKKGKPMAIDAHSSSCDCHPGKQTFGRMINHSRTFNLRPRLFTLQKDEEEKDVILLIATKAIKVNEELSFDYGVDCRSFGGEGSGISWL